MPSQQPPPIDPEGLEAYSTDIEHMRKPFKALVAAPSLPKRLLTEAEALAQQYEYNDHLTTLRLTQGHMVWEGALSADFGSRLSGYDGALHFYRHALIYALRYNRFMLDEVLWGGGVTTPLRPLIPHCLERGEEGRRMLAALRDWWRADTNDVGAPRPDSISPIPEGIALLEAERIAREQEPGDGSPQRTVAERIEAALG